MKKISVILICTILSLCFIHPVDAMDFSTTISVDTDNHWSEENLETLNSLGIMNGYDGKMNPDTIITRGEFTAIITRAFGMTSTEATKTFSDIDKNHIFYENICGATNAGIVDGFPDGTFRADNMITREEIILILSRLSLSAPRVSEVDFVDIDSAYPYRSELFAVSSDGIINGYPDNTFRPYGKTSRAEAASMIVKAMKAYMNPVSEPDASKTAVEFLTEHFKGKKGRVTGSAEEDFEYISFVFEKAKEMGNEIQNIPLEFDVVSVEGDGPFATVNVNYNVEHIRTNYTKTYSGKSEVKLIETAGDILVYEHNSQITKSVPINMTWEVFANPPSYTTEGVNVVSPTCFVVSDTASKSGKSTYIADNLWFNSTLTDNYVRYAKENNFEIWAMYKTDFDTDTATRVLRDAGARKKVSEYLVENILRFCLDGINFDYENMFATDKGAYTNHVKEIALICHTLGATVSVDVTKYEPTSLNWSMCYDRNALAKYADYIALMAYDQYYSGSKIAGPVAGLDWTKNCVELTLKEVSNEKLILGMPFYIRCWKEKNGKVVSSEAISMSKAVQYANDNYAVVEYDSKHGLNRYSWWSGEYRYVFWMENAQTIAQRAKIAKEYNLAGVASWRRGFETADVWQSIKTVLFG